MTYPDETRKKQKWVDVFCPRCGEPLGFKEMPKLNAVWSRKCYDCGGECHVIRTHKDRYLITYTKEL